MLVKDKYSKVEYGDYNTYANLKPIKLVEIDFEYGVAIIVFQFEDSDKTITLCPELTEIDLNSFGIISHIEYTLYLVDFGNGKTQSKEILKSNNRQDLIDYKNNNQDILSRNTLFTIGEKVIID